MTSPLAFVPSFLTEYDAVALCAEIDPDSWFPDQGGPTGRVKALCRRCELIEPCLQWALDHAEPYGIWGGKSERERRAIKRGRPAPPRRPARTWTDEDTKRQILDLTDREWSTAEIARELGISTRTVTRVRASARQEAA